MIAGMTITESLAQAEDACAAALERWGAQLQATKAIEETGELMVALSRFPKRATPAEVAEEIADVMIMCRQLAMIFGDELVADAIARKAARLRELVAKGGNGDARSRRQRRAPPRERGSTQGARAVDTPVDGSPA